MNIYSDNKNYLAIIKNDGRHSILCDKFESIDEIKSWHNLVVVSMSADGKAMTDITRTGRSLMAGLRPDIKKRWKVGASL